MPFTSPLPWHRRLEARVVAAAALLVAGALAAGASAATRAVTTRSRERASDDLQAARSAFYRLTDDRAAFASAQASLVTALPVFRAHMTDARLADDVATLQALAGEYRRQLKADFCVVTDRVGRWTATSGWPDDVQSAGATGSTITDAVSGHPSRDVSVVHDHLFLVVSEPARFGDEVLGTFTVGYALNDAVAEQLAEVTHAEVNLVNKGRVYASSLPRAERRALAALVGTNPGWQPSGILSDVQRVGGNNYVTGSFAIPSSHGESPAQLLLLQDWSPTQRFISEVQRRLLAAGAVIFVLALGGSIVFGRRMTRPLRDLASTAKEIAGGEWTRQVPVRGSVEAAVTAQAFNEMMISLRHWHEQARKRDDELRQAQKMEAIGRLAGGVAHDFNNLLTAINGYVGFLLEALDENDPRRKDASEILEAAERAAGLTKQLLAFSRRQVVTPRLLALDQIVARTEQMLRRLIGEDITLVTAKPPGIWPVLADASQMEQVLLNLAVNARDAMPDGGTLRIELANVAVEDTPGPLQPPKLVAGTYVRLSITDTGCGMSPDVVAHIFEPFFTTKEEGRGTGLGLAMVHGIVEQAGGTIDVETAVGSGTTFHIYLPDASDFEPVGDPRPEAAKSEGRGSETVLLVEDDDRVGAVIANALRKTGYTVLQARHSEEALTIARSHDTPIHLLLTDVVMPGMNGRELADEVAATSVGTRVLFMSGYPDDAILRYGIETASAQFIQKPFSMDVLAARIRQTLE